jgi:hypothetical protein
MLFFDPAEGNRQGRVRAEFAGATALASRPPH